MRSSLRPKQIRNPNGRPSKQIRNPYGRPHRVVRTDFARLALLVFHAAHGKAIAHVERAAVTLLRVASEVALPCKVVIAHG